jgi:O-acetylhomoserine/O-acetylserine sulfhydrylase-like pyridoxal-dependent enzyme
MTLGFDPNSYRIATNKNNAQRVKSTLQNHEVKWVKNQYLSQLDHEKQESETKEKNKSIKLSIKNYLNFNN